ncbi:hypothetical protein COLO4_09729 [Corchorus olitorius]|uniref:Uncharacterized protein n=1 Tax=Corchorus olitorius TaxID=93759 RepID=A0A1R3KB41_9ROSI|nr:hypothetical protein COLO4_09729 [Corchorus olitorius]
MGTMLSQIYARPDEANTKEMEETVKKMGTMLSEIYQRPDESKTKEVEETILKQILADQMKMGTMLSESYQRHESKTKGMEETMKKIQADQMKMGTMLRQIHDEATMKKILATQLKMVTLEKLEKTIDGSLEKGLKEIKNDGDTLKMLGCWFLYIEITVYVEHEIDIPIVQDEVPLVIDGELGCDSQVGCDKAQLKKGPSGVGPTEVVDLTCPEGEFNEINEAAGVGEVLLNPQGFLFEDIRAETGKAEAEEKEASFEKDDEQDLAEEKDDEQDLEEIDAAEESDDELDPDDEDEEDVDEDEADDNENLAAYLVRSRAFTEDEEDPECVVALEKILKSVGRGKRQKTAPETQDEDAEHVDPLEEILRGKATEDAANSDGEADEDERGYQSPVYLSDDYHSLVGSDEDPEHDDAQWRKSSPSCPWFIYAGWNEEIKAIQIRNMGDDHTCSENYKNKAVTCDVIAENFHETIRDCPRLKTSQEFRELWDYAEELRSKNPGSTIKVAKDLDLGVGDGFTLMSDKQKGLKAAVKDRLPTAEHRNCARHVFSNWGGRRLPKTYEFAYWNIVKATTPREWDDRFAELDRIDN